MSDETDAELVAGVRRGSREAAGRLAATESTPAEALHARFPEGPQDAESIFVNRSGDIFVVTRGRIEAITLSRYPAPQRVGETAALERVRELFPAPQDDRDRVSAATTTPDGRFVGVRTCGARGDRDDTDRWRLPPRPVGTSSSAT